MPETQTLEEVRALVRAESTKIIRSTPTSQLIILLATEGMAEEMFDAVMVAVPESIRHEEYHWLATAVVGEIDRRVPIPA